MQQKNSNKPRSKSSIKCSPYVVPQKAFVMEAEVGEFVSTEVQRLVKEMLPSFLFDAMQTLTVADVALLTNYSKPTVIDWIRAGKLSAIRPGKEYVITIADYKQFVSDNRINAKIVQGHFKIGLKQNAI